MTYAEPPNVAHAPVSLLHATHSRSLVKFPLRFDGGKQPHEAVYLDYINLFAIMEETCEACDGSGMPQLTN